MNGPLLLTGASGWFGRTALHVFEQEYGGEALRREVIAFASGACWVDFGSPHGPIRALPLEELSSFRSPAGLLHLAFLTRDRVEPLGWQRYAALNRAITGKVVELLKDWPTMPVVSCSSGAALSAEGRDPESLIQSNPYAVLKLQEELSLAALAEKRLAVVFRVFAASGRFMTRADQFALGDFLLQGLANRPIVVKNPALVMRSYIHTGTLMRAAWRLIQGRPDPALETPGFHRLDACTHTVRLSDLARFIARRFGVPFEMPPAAADPSQQDLYIGDALPMTALLHALQVPLCDLNEQISDTCLGLQAEAAA